MSRFYFELDDGQGALRDETGTECRNIEEAHDQAISTLAQVFKDEVQGGEPRDCGVLVRDAQGRPLFRAKLSFVEKWLI
ncbi:DUF6894 family protein [Methylobacterium nigriterrae]|uniref:DUF6894 family protein n=1 Tax=Methylobacterium nigriterrae TaxID=3127512 RepID=UPI0030132DD1